MCLFPFKVRDKFLLLIVISGTGLDIIDFKLHIEANMLKCYNI